MSAPPSPDFGRGTEGEGYVLSNGRLFHRLYSDVEYLNLAFRRSLRDNLKHRALTPTPFRAIIYDG